MISTSRRNRILAAIALLLTMTGVALASSYATRQSLQTQDVVAPKPVAAKTIRHPQPQPQQVAHAAPQEPQCDDGNILGYVAGGAAGGLVGSQIGHGTGKTVATIGGVLGGGYLGGQAIPLHNVTCRNK